ALPELRARRIDDRRWQHHVTTSIDDLERDARRQALEEQPLLLAIDQVVARAEERAARRAQLAEVVGEAAAVQPGRPALERRWGQRLERGEERVRGVAAGGPELPASDQARECPVQRTRGEAQGGEHDRGHLPRREPGEGADQDYLLELEVRVQRDLRSQEVAERLAPQRARLGLDGIG